jgi:hypothetical protein
MRKLNVCCCVAVVCLTWGVSGSLADDTDTAAINKVVSECVKLVHDFSNDSFFKRFDAYYNPGTGLIVDNRVYVGDRPAFFQFGKCMTQHGFPLGSNKSDSH